MAENREIIHRNLKVSKSLQLCKKIKKQKNRTKEKVIVLIVIWKGIRVRNSKGGLAQFLDECYWVGCSNNKGSKKKIIPENLGLRKKKKDTVTIQIMEKSSEQDKKRKQKSSTRDELQISIFYRRYQGCRC